MKSNKVEQEPKKTIPTTIEGIAIHLGYIGEKLKSLDDKMTTLAINSVNRDEWNNHLKRDEDHETRLRGLETKIGEQETEISNIITTIKVWGSAATIGLALLEIALRFLIK